MDVASGDIDVLFQERVLGWPPPRACHHTGVALHAGSQSALARVHADKALHLVRNELELFVRGRSAEQRIAVDLLADEDIGIVSLGGNAGTGKSVLAIAAGLEAVLERGTHKRITCLPPLFAVGGKTTRLPARF